MIRVFILSLAFFLATLGAVGVSTCAQAVAQDKGWFLLQTAAARQKTDRSEQCACAVDDCDFNTEIPGQKINCGIERNSRRMYCKWISDSARVLEVGARYGQTTCALAKKLAVRGHLASVEADPSVWQALEHNVKQKRCKVQLIKGVIGPRDRTVTYDGDPGDGDFGYGTYTSMMQTVPTPHHTLESLGAIFNTLAIDCEGCFASFLKENPALEDTLNIIIVEVHNHAEKSQVKSLLKNGWTLKDHVGRQHVLCSPGGKCEVHDQSC